MRKLRHSALPDQDGRSAPSSGRAPVRRSTIIAGVLAIAISAAVLLSQAGINLPGRGVAVGIMIIIGAGLVARGAHTMAASSNGSDHA